MSHDDPAQTFEPGDVVYTVDDEFQQEWWYNWPGVVRSQLRSGREYLVEFMGFDSVDKRHFALPVASIQHLADHQVGARLHRIVNHLRLPDDAKRRGSIEAAKALKRPAPKVPVEMPDDDLSDDDGDVLN